MSKQYDPYPSIQHEHTQCANNTEQAINQPSSMITELWKSITRNDLTLLLLSTTCPVLANSVDPDQLASEEAN